MQRGKTRTLDRTMLFALPLLAAAVLALVSHLVLPNFLVACIASTIATVALIWALIGYHSMDWSTEIPVISCAALVASAAVGAVVHLVRRRSRASHKNSASPINRAV